MQPAVDAVTLGRGNFLQQLRQFLRPHAPQGADIHMPQGLRLTDQTSPGACLLPVTQSPLGRMLWVMDENRHGISLMRLRPLRPKQRMRFGELKQKSSATATAIPNERP